MPQNFIDHSRSVFIPLILLILVSGCRDPLPKPQALTLEQEIDLAIPAPSGLTFGSSSSQLLLVSDTESKFYRISTSGQIIGSINIDVDDAEGISWEESKSEIWVIDEAKGEIIKLSSGGGELERIAIELSFTSANDRLEGISLDSENERVFILNEKDPGMLAILNYSGSVLEEYVLTWAEDFSGIYYDPTEDVLWMISDQSRLLAKCDLEGNPMELYNLPFTKAEGLAVDRTASKVYIVNDETEKLYVFGI